MNSWLKENYVEVSFWALIILVLGLFACFAERKERPNPVNVQDDNQTTSSIIKYYYYRKFFVR